MTQGTEQQHTEQQHTPRACFMVTQRAVIYNPQTQKYCLAKIANHDKTFSKKYGPWDLFGGHMEIDELEPEESLRREVREEAGIDVDIRATLGVRDFSGYGMGEERNRRRLLVGYLAQCTTDEITLSREHSEYKWFTVQEIMTHKDVKQWIKDLVQSAEQRRAELEAKDTLLRTLAEFDNYKKRTAQQQKDFSKYASEQVIMDMLPILDNFHAATHHIPEDQADSPWLTGIMYIQKQMEKVFEDAGVTVLDIKKGDVFDPETMEAIKSTTEKEQSKKSTKKQKVSKVVQKGYMIKDRLLRPARVEV